MIEVLSFDADRFRNRLLDLDAPGRVSFSHDSFIPSAVAVPVLPGMDGSHDLILIERATSEMGKHSGEMAFPGGKYEPSDGNLRVTALRELHEEIGIPPSKVRLLGFLHDVVTPQFFIITPVVVQVLTGVKFDPCEHEVASIFKVPVSFFACTDNYSETTFIVQGKQIAVGRFRYQDGAGMKKEIFGATAHVITNFLELVHGISLQMPGTRRARPADFRRLFQD